VKKLHPLIEEMLIWIRGRFTLTGEEKVWLLMILIILWTGLIGRYIHLKTQQPEPLSPQQVERLLSP
jgi:hypothetical protein